MGLLIHGSQVHSVMFVYIQRNSLFIRFQTKNWLTNDKTQKFSSLVWYRVDPHMASQLAPNNIVQFDTKIKQ